MIHQSIECRSSGKTIQASLYYEVSPAQVYSLHFVSDEWGHLTTTSYNLFDSLCRLRGVLESDSFLICCNGARVDAWITRMGKEMGGGRRVYITRFGEPISRKNLVPTLDPTDCDKCGSLSDHLDHHIQWMRSILGEDYLNDDASVPTQATHESKLHAEGIVYQVEGEFDAEITDANTFPESVLGAWKLDSNGQIVEPFTPRSELPSPQDINSPWPK